MINECCDVKLKILRTDFIIRAYKSHTRRSLKFFVLFIKALRVCNPKSPPARMILDVHLFGEVWQIGMDLVEAVRFHGLHDEGDVGRGGLVITSLQGLEKGL